MTRRADSLKRAAVARTRLSESLQALPEALTGIAAAAIIWRGAALGLSAGTIAAGLAALGLAARPLRDFMGVANRAAAFRAAHRKLVEALSRPIAPVRAVEGVRLPSGPLALQLQDAVVGDGNPLSLHLPSGSRGFLPEGADAAAIFCAIAGQEPLQAGDIKLGGAAIESLSPGSLRRGVALITDSPIVLRGSLRRALTLGLIDRPSDEKIAKRIAEAGLTVVLESLGRFDRRLREGARTLSRDERVKLSLLRAALGKPGLILIAPGVEIEGREARGWLERHSATVLWARPAAQHLQLVPPVKGAA